jgi:hypothetical protein
VSKLNFIIFLLSPCFAIGQCEYLSILSVNVNAFDEGRLTIHAQNIGEDIFSYPGFRIYNEDDELIAQENVEFFGISSDSYHNINHMLPMVIPDYAYDLRIELWTNFYSDLACTISGVFTLLPSEICAMSTFGIIAMTNEPVQETLSASLIDFEGMQVLDVTAEFGQGLNSYFSEVCLAPGCYTAYITSNNALVSNSYQTFISSIAYGTGYSELHEENGTAIQFSASVWSDCSVNDIQEPANSLPWAFPNPFSHELRFSGMPPNTRIELLDATGKMILTTTESKISTDLLPSGIYLLRAFKGDGNCIGRATVVRQ